MKRLLFSIIILIIGASIFYVGMNEMEKANDSENWLPTPGERYDSKVVSDHTRKGGTQYSARINYKYMIEDNAYSGNRVSFGEITRADYDTALSIVNKFPEGKNVQVYYNPENPRESVLEPGTKGRGIDIILGSGVLFSLIGSFMFLSALIRR